MERSLRSTGNCTDHCRSSPSQSLISSFLFAIVGTGNLENTLKAGRAYSNVKRMLQLPLVCIKVCAAAILVQYEYGICYTTLH